MPANTKIQLRRGNASQWSDQVLSAGEIGFELDTGRFKIGNGLTAWNSLGYANVLPSEFNELVDDRLNAALVAGNNISLTYDDNANTLTIATDALDTEQVEDLIGTKLVGASGVAVSYNDTTGVTTVSLSDPTIQVSDITDFVDGVNDRVADLLTAGSNVQLTYVDNNNDTSTLTIAVTGVSLSGHTHTSSNITDFNSAVSGLLPVKNIVQGSGISVTSNAGTYTVALSDPTIQVADITDLTSSASELNLLDGSIANTIVNSKAVIYGANGEIAASSIAATGNITVGGNLTVTGSGLVASNINNFDTQVRTNRLDQMAAPTASVSLNSQKITNLADPTSDQDAATKAYVDAARSGLDVKQSVCVATTENINLASFTPGTAIDGVTVLVNNRVLVKDQSNAAENGIYICAVIGGLIRASDADTSTEVTAGMFTFVTEGTTNADSGWVLTTNDTITLGTTGLAFAQFSGAGQITAGNGLTKTGNTINAVGTAGRVVVNADSIDLDTVTRTDSSGSAGVSFVQTVTTDSYGRVTAVTTGSAQDASTSAKGIASFNSDNFSVTSGAVSIKASGVGNTQLEHDSLTIGATEVVLGTTVHALSGVSAANPVVLTYFSIDGGTP